MKTIYKKLLFLLLILPLNLLAQSGFVGTILDSKSKQPLSGVNIIVQGSGAGTTSDFDGKFKLPKTIKGNKVVFSYIGYSDKIVTFTGQQNLTIYMTDEQNDLKEVVVQVGYGTVKRKDATGSITTITAKDFNKGAVVSVDQLLSGKAAGVRITTDGGNPDTAPNIRIRGGASLDASNNPLIIIDGVPIGNDSPAGVSNPLSLINPNDVESFTILKDASATAIYGVRASNGVILITTKKGSSGSPEFTFSSTFSVGKVGKTIDVMSGTDYVRFIQQYFPSRTNSLGIPDGSGQLDNASTPQIEGRIIANTNWQDQILRTSISQDYNFSARANLVKKIPFRASIGYNNTQGLIKTNDYKRFSYSLKMTPKLLDDHLKIDINAKGTLTDKNVVDESAALYGAVSMDPTKPVYDYSVGNIFGGYFQNTILNGNRNLLEGATNPLAVLEQRQRPERVLRFLGNIEFDYKLHFLPALRAVVNLGLDASQSRVRESYSDKAIQTYSFNQGTNPNTNYLFNPGLNYQENQTVTNKTMDAYLVYSKNLTGFVTKFDLQGGYTYQGFKADGNKNLFVNDPLTGIRISKPNVTISDTNYYNPLNLQAFFARTNFDLLNRYLFTFTFRADASSLFQKNKRWGYFPSVGFAWKIKDESFLKNSGFVKDLKLRLGYGKTGQADITKVAGFFPSRPLFGVGSSNSQYLPGVGTYTANPFIGDITWEKSTTINLGLDFEFFKKGILSGSFDIYKRKTTDLLAVVPLSPGQGLTNSFINNVGSTESKGFELNLNIRPIQTESFNLSFNTNIAYSYAKVTDLKGLNYVQASESGLPTQTGLFLANHAVGYQPYSAYVYQQIYDASGKPIVGAYADLNGDGKITDEDRYYKSLRPNWTFGFGTNISYKNWDLSAGFRGQLGGQVYNSRTSTIGFIDRAIQGTSSALNNVLNFYNGSANPLFQNFNSTATGNPVFSDYLLEDATFLRCENITLGYKFTKFIKKSTLRVYTSANNVFIITKYTGQDPENFNSIDNNFYPRPRVFTFGVNLDF